MASAATDILTDIAGALRAAGAFAEVALGSPGSTTAVPRAHVVHHGEDEFAGDDGAASRWRRLHVEIRIRTRAESPSAGLARAADLSAAAADALLADPYRGGRCCDLPIGRATEVGRCEFSRDLKSPEVQIALAVRCHFDAEDQP